jgi:hypothetical protein
MRFASPPKIYVHGETRTPQHVTRIAKDSEIRN